MEEKKYSERDLIIATELGALTKAIYNLDDKLTNVVQNKESEHKAMWHKIDSHAEKIESHSKLINWIIGVGVGIQAAWAALIQYFKTH